ncbi:hypothetical protein Tco_0137889 [Tanacetum coccineum]
MGKSLRLFIKGKKNGRMMLDSIDNGLLVNPTIENIGRLDLRNTLNSLKHNNFRCLCVQAKNIILHGLPPDVHALVNHQEAAKDIWDRGETLYEYYWRFSQLINDMHTIGMTMQQVQVNTKFLNDLPPEWSKFVTDVKLAKSLYTTNYDQLGIATTSRRNYAAGQAKIVKSYNCLGEGHMAKQCTRPKRPRSFVWFKEKLMLAEAQEAGQILDIEQLAFIADPGIAEAQVAHCDLDVLSGVPYSNTYLNDMINQEVKEKESLSTTLTVFKTKCKEKESKYMDKEIVLENQNKELENTLCKLYRSTQAMHMLTKPQGFYDNTHKQALGYQNPFHLKKAQEIKPTLYDGSVIAKEHDVIFVIDDEETLILEEESRSKMLDKQNDPISIKQKIHISPIDYLKLNKIKEDFSKRFVNQKELSDGTDI